MGVSLLTQWSGKASPEIFQQRLEMRGEPPNKNSQCQGPEVPKRDLQHAGGSGQPMSRQGGERQAGMTKGQEASSRALALTLSSSGSRSCQEDGMSQLGLQRSTLAADGEQILGGQRDRVEHH